MFDGQTPQEQVQTLLGTMRDLLQELEGQDLSSDAQWCVEALRGKLEEVEALLPQLAAQPLPALDLAPALEQPTVGIAASPAVVRTAPASAEELSERGFGAPLRLVSRPDVDEQDLLVANGLLATTGDPLLVLDTQSACAVAQGQPPAGDEQVLADRRVNAPFGLVFGDANSLPRAKWAVVVNATEDAALLRALTPLIVKRCADQGLPVPTLEFRPGETCVQWLARNQVDLNAPLKHGMPVLIYQPGETIHTFLSRHRTSPNPVEPELGVPFYLLLLGRPGPISPADSTYIPFEFQYDLDLFWGVGRLCFTDPLTGAHQLDAYTRYAERVVAYEQRARPATRRHIAYFGVKNNLDLATRQSAEDLITPMYQGTGALQPLARRADTPFTQELWLGPQATRANLDQILRGQGPHGLPALLFSASHGLGYPASPEHLDQLKRYQGALVCQDWPGSGAVKLEHVYAADQLSPETALDGLIAFLFACYGAGCPQEDEFDFKNQQRKIIAPYPLLAQLPQRLLQNGALAVFGHVDRAWSYSFRNNGVNKQTQRFDSVLVNLMNGHRVGYATDQFNVTQGQIAMDLAGELERARIYLGMTMPAELARKLSASWIARNDARNFVLLGDPAVRLRFAEDQPA